MKAMIRCHDYLQELPDHHLLLQVHDELVTDFPMGGKKHLPLVCHLKQLMEQSGTDIGVPLTVSYKYHPEDWSQAVTI